MEIKVIGSGCDSCTLLYERTLQALADFNKSVSVEKVEKLTDIVRLGVMRVPALMADGRVVISGYVPSVKKIKSVLKEFF